MEQDLSHPDFSGNIGRPLPAPRLAGNMIPPIIGNFDSKFPMPQRPKGMPMGHGNPPDASPHLYGYRPIQPRGGFRGFPIPRNMGRHMEMPLGNNPPSGFDMQMPSPHQGMMGSMSVMEDHYGQAHSMGMSKSRGFGHPMTPTSNHMYPGGPMSGPVMQLNPMGGMVLDSIPSDDQFSSLLSAAAPTRSFPLAINFEGDRFVARGLEGYFGDKHSSRLKLTQKAVFSHESILKFLFANVDKSLLLEITENGNNSIEDNPMATQNLPSEQARNSILDGRAASRISESGSAVSAPKRGRPRLNLPDSSRSSNFKSDTKKGSAAEAANTAPRSDKPSQSGDTLDFVKSRLKEHNIVDSSTAHDAFTDISFVVLEVQKSTDPSRLEEIVVGLAAVAKENLIRSIAANITRKKISYANEWEIEDSITPLDFQKWLFSVAENEPPSSLVGIAAREIVNQKPVENTQASGIRDLV
eukprot:GHVP01022560.1.p1 GENE.GHVP01022560.1~~GHVP01022560.1.p1  ORF type:complete len:468 (+),score=92.31 GHVP01022560.1:63-1466(+)